MTSHNTAGGNRSRVVREALVTLADMEDHLDKIEADPAFLEMMRQSDVERDALCLTKKENAACAENTARNGEG
jgi:Arc/MetJ-type ribon-helix-helix transcriptional regulator